MTPKKKAPAKRGRKPLPADQKPEQLTVRLSPKVKFGLELLARAQRRSLSSAMEWAVLRGLHTYEVTDAGHVLGDVLDALWPPDSEIRMLENLRRFAPQMLSDDDRSLLEGVFESAEAEAIREEEFQRDVDRKPGADPTSEASAYSDRAWAAFDQFIDAHWKAIRAAIVTRSLQGKPGKGLSICDLAGFVGRYRAGDPVDVLEALSKEKPRG